jgi:hypothetical protein
MTLGLVLLRSSSIRIGLLALASLPIALFSAQAQSPRDELLKLVPDDVTLGLVMANLRGQTEKLAAAPWLERIKGSHLAQAIAASPEMEKLTKVDQDLRAGLNLSLAQLRDEIFGEAVVLAFRHAPGKKGQEQALLLLQVRDAARLAALIERLNQVQLQTRELKETVTRRHQGAAYVCRKEKEADRYYLLQGPLLVYSTSEAMIKQVIERQQMRDLRAPLVQRLRSSGKELAMAWLNPRAFDQELRAAAEKGPASAEAFQRLWRALDIVTLTVNAEKDLEVQISVQGRPDAVTPALRRLFDTAARPSATWRHFPPDAILTMGGRLDVAALGDTIAELMPPKERAKLKQDLRNSLGAVVDIDQVLARVGPDWGFCLAAPADAAALPDALFALRIQPGPQDAPVDQIVFNALQTGATLVVLGHNRSDKEPIKLRTMRQGDVVVKYLAGDQPGKDTPQPAFALKAGYLVLGSSPAAIARFAASPTAPASGEETPLFRLSLQQLRRLAQGQRQALASLLVERKVQPEEIDRWLTELQSVLGLADNIELTLRQAPGQVTWTLRLQVLKKSS